MALATVILSLLMDKGTQQLIILRGDKFIS